MVYLLKIYTSHGQSVFDECAKRIQSRFTVGINDDVTHTSLTVDPSFKLQKKFIQAMFFGLGADGTVGQQKLH